ncbi:MAG: DUF3592 domain-containing protein [Verrucomicrobiaceae bacterium]
MRKTSLAGPIYLIFIGTLVLIMGGIFVALLWKSYRSAQETRSWPVVQATILESAVQERKLGAEIPIEYSLKIIYEYQFEEEFYINNHLKRRENPWYKERAKIEPEVKKWLVGQPYPLHVNPDVPQESVLAHETKAGGYSIWFPSLFVIGGLGIIGGAIRKILGRKDQAIAP